MIRVENLSYGFPAKDLYKDISFTIEPGQHCALIGSNGTGKTTLIHMILDPEAFLYDGKIEKSSECRIGYVSQFSKEEKDQEKMVFSFLSEKFVENQAQTEAICAEMATAEDLEPLFETYQRLLNLYQAMDGDNYESNIKKQLHVTGMSHLEHTELSNLSGGEYKLLQVMKEMLLQPNLLIMDEPDIFLDFQNLNGLRKLINAYQGTLLVITHNRYLLNHCFDKILHLEDTDLQEFDGNYMAYNLALMQKKIEMQEQVVQEQEEIQRTEKMVEQMRNRATKVANATYGRALKAKSTHLERLRARAIKEPFVDVPRPKIVLPNIEVDKSDEAVLSVEGYQVAFDKLLLENVSFVLKAGEKVAVVGPNGTGKTTLLRDIYRQSHPAIHIGQDLEIGFLSQLHGEMLDENHTVYEEFEQLGFETKKSIQEFLKDYCFEPETLDQKIAQLSGGEQNLLQLAKIAVGNANLLLLDEPTSHLDTNSQLALENAISKYNGAVLMVSHDFYNIVNCADYVLYVDGQSIRRMRIRSFRKMIYENHFDKSYLELEQKKKELEMRIANSLREKDYETARQLCQQLEPIIQEMELE